ncbi:O-antigen ligase family protein [Candidatus Gottesmanbacteria bacterium]|nr:O-antigen ligase family protein [Candidatus Gottesmanbacteria bacterium]
MDFSGKCTKIIHILFILLFALVPLLVTPWNYELFEYNKMMAVYALTVAIATTWAVKAIHEKKLSIPRTPLDIPIALFVLSQTVSTLFSIDPHVSWFGYYSRFNGGLLSVLCYVALYYIFISTYSIQASTSESRIENLESRSKKKQITSQKPFTFHSSLFTLLYTTLISAFFVALYAVLERMGIDSHLWVQDVQNRVFSSLGQPNWLAAYLVALVPIAWAMGINQLSAFSSQLSASGDTKQKKIQGLTLCIVYWILSLLFFFVLLSTRSKSGLGAFAVADVLFWGLLFLATKLDKKFLQPCALIHISFAVIIFFNGVYIEGFDKYFTFSSLQQRIFQKSSSQSTPYSLPPTPSAKAPLLETGGTDSGIIRTYVWSGAITAWESSVKTFFIGTGTESFAFAFFQYRPKGHNLTSEWDFLYNKAHNEYVNFLTTTGIFGLLSYLSILGVFVAWYSRILNSEYGILKKSKPTLSGLQYSQFTMQLALFSGWISILITNFFGFSVVITQVYLFLFPAIMFVQYNLQIPISNIQQGGERIFKLTLQYPFDKASMWIIGGSGVSLIILLGIFWDADRLFAKGYRYSRVGSAEAQAVSFTEAAILRNPTEPLYHDELSTQLAAVAVKAMDNNEAARASTIAQRAIKENDIAITTSPKNVNFWKSRVKILYAFSAFDPSLYKLSLETLKQTQELSPNDPKIAYNIAVIAGKQGDSATAVGALKKAIEMKPNYRDAYYALYIFYTESKQIEDAKATIREYLSKVDPQDKELKELVQ